jgi:hypothetical protein
MMQTSKSKVLITLLVGACFALVLAGCQAGGSVTGSAAPTSTPAPINVPAGYQGIVIVTFSATTTYDQAVSILESAGMKLQALCPSTGPVAVDSGVTPTPITQQDTFPSTHQLTAVGVPSLTQAMLQQVATSPQVTAIDHAPKITCPLRS